MRMMTPEELVAATNILSMKMIELGADFSGIVNELADFIVERCDGTALTEEDSNKRIQEIFDAIFQRQIEVFYQGAMTFLNVMGSYGAKNNLDFVMADLDEITEQCGDSQEVMIKSTNVAVESMRSFTSTKVEYSADETSFRDRLRALVGNYIDSSFMFGLTDAQRVNYVKYTTRGQDPRRFWTMLEETFPGIFETPLSRGDT